MTDWTNKIVGHGEEDPEQLLASPRNWRIHPRMQQDALEEVLDQVGWVKSVIVNRVTGHVVDGHLRVMLAMRREERVPVSYVDLTEREEQVVLATIDPVAGLAIVDDDRLQSLVSDLNDSLQGTLRDMMAGIVSLDDLDDQLSPDPSQDAQDSILPPSDGSPLPSSSPDDSEALRGPRLLDVSCPHCGAEWPADLNNLDTKAKGTE